MKTIVCVSDLQCPLHDQRAVNSLAEFIHSTQPDMVVSVGDEADFTGISRWAEGTPLQYETNLDKERNATVAVLRQLGVQHVVRSNHTDRLYNTVMMKAPGMRSVPELRLENFLRFDELGITYHRKPWELAPGWLLAHGDEGNISQVPGSTALNLAKRFGKSVVCGHTHRAGLTHHTEAVSGVTTRVLYGLETGHLMDMRKATYLKGGYGNWKQAFGILHVDGKTVSPQVVFLNPDGSFIVDGMKWSGK